MKLLILFILFTGCTAIKMLVGGKPGISDYKKYKYSEVEKANQAFEFPNSKGSYDLDSLYFNETEPMLFGKQVSLQTFLKQKKTKEFLVIYNDSVVYNYTDPGYSHSWINTFSISKSLVSLLVGIALDEGAIKSLDDPIIKYIPEIATNSAFDCVTIKHLLMMTSGLKFTKISSDLLKTIASDEAKEYFTNNLRTLIAKARRQYEPGKYWVYKNTDVDLLSWVLERATGFTISEYFTTKIWSKIGSSENAAWTVDKKMVERTHCCFYTTAADLAKIGRLLLNNGQYNNEQVIPISWIHRLTTFDSTQMPPPPENKDLRTMQHQYLWWKPNYPAAHDFQANGVYGQCLYVDPDSRTIIVKLANQNSTGYPYRKIAKTLSGQLYKPVIPRYRLYN